MQFGYQELGWDKKYRLRLASAAPSTCAEMGPWRALWHSLSFPSCEALRGAHVPNRYIGPRSLLFHLLPRIQVCDFQVPTSSHSLPTVIH
jgi:hypothetical protein